MGLGVKALAKKLSDEMLLSNEERQRIVDLFDIYDLIELLDLDVEEFIDAFDFKIVECEEIMRKVIEG